MFHPTGTNHTDPTFLPLQVFPLAWDRNEVSHLSRCCGQELTQGEEPKGRESSHGAQALPLSSGAAKPFLLRGPADPSSSSRVSAYRAETPRLQINLWLQLEPGERGRAWRRGGGRRGSSRQSRAEQSSSFMPCWAAPASCSRSRWKGWTGRRDTGVKLGYSSCKYKAAPWVSPRIFPKAYHHPGAGQLKSNTG